MISIIKNIWENKRWDLFIILAIIVLILFAIFDRSTDKDTSYQGIPTIKKKKSTSKPELMCKQIAENYFKLPFNKVRPKFLKYTSGKNLELDMYNPLLNLAIEYNGKQHRIYTPYFHKSKLDFINQQNRDKFKQEKCQTIGIKLIIVPDTISHDKIKEFLEQKFKEYGY